MKEAGSSKYLTAEQGDKDILKPKVKPSNEQIAGAPSKPKDPAVEEKVLEAPEAAAETPGEVAAMDDVELAKPVEASTEQQEELAMPEDPDEAARHIAAEHYNGMNGDVGQTHPGAMHEDLVDVPVMQGMNVDFLALVDTLQSLGVDALQANRCVASIIRKKPSLYELNGVGNICEAANWNHKDLNMLGKLA